MTGIKNMGKPAVIYHGEQVEIQGIINAIRKKLSGFDKNNSTIALYLDRTPYLVAAVNACLIEGCTYVPLDPGHPVQRTNAILYEVEPDAVLTHQNYFEKLPSHLSKLNIDELVPINDGCNISDYCQDMDRIAYIIFTSGSTGKPKGVMVPYRALHNLLLSIEKKPGISNKDRVLAITTVSFDIAVFELIHTFYTGAQITLLDENEAKDPIAIMNALIRDDITIMQATPVTWKMLIEAGWQGKTDMTAFSTGEALPFELAEELQGRCKELWNLYGPTETTVWVTIDKVSPGKPVSIGEPIDNIQIYILDENMKELPRGKEGDFYIGGKGLAAGYFRRPDLTEKVFLQNPFKPGEIIYKTGDLVRYNDNGRLECLGRSDFQVKIRGFRIELGDVESSLIKYKGITNVVVHAQFIRNGMKELVAYIVSQNPIDSTDLISFLSESLPDYMIPSHYVFLDRLPLNTSGKIDRKALPLPEVKEVLDDYGTTDLSLEERFLHIWKKVLFKQEITPDQNFFELGGNSILAVQTLREMNEICNNALTLSTFFKYPFINRLTEEVTKVEKEEDTVLLLNGVKDGTPLFCLGGIDLYQSLADCITNRPVYAVYLPYEEQLIDHIQRDALDEWEYMTIEGMAGAYLREIKKFYSTGVYHLIGASIAGMIGFEASRMIFNEEGVRGELFILDTHLSHAKHLNCVGKLAALVRRIRNRNHNPKNRKNMSAMDMEYIISMRDKINERAEKIFDKEAKPIEGDIHLVKATLNKYGKGETWDSDLGWSQLVRGKLHCYELSDDHLGILTFPKVRRLAEYLENEMGKNV